MLHLERVRDLQPNFEGKETMSAPPSSPYQRHHRVACGKIAQGGLPPQKLTGEGNLSIVGSNFIQSGLHKANQGEVTRSDEALALAPNIYRTKYAHIMPGSTQAPQNQGQRDSAATIISFSQWNQQWTTLTSMRKQQEVSLSDAAKQSQAGKQAGRPTSAHRVVARTNRHECRTPTEREPLSNNTEHQTYTRMPHTSLLFSIHHLRSPVIDHITNYSTTKATLTVSSRPTARDREEPNFLPVEHGKLLVADEDHPPHERREPDGRVLVGVVLSDHDRVWHREKPGKKELTRKAGQDRNDVVGGGESE